MLTNNYISNFLELEDAIVKDIKNSGGKKHIFIEMEHREHICPKCGEVTSKIHDYRMQKIKDIPYGTTPVILHLRKRRHVCKNCGKKFYEKVPFLPKYQRTTNRLWAHVINLLDDCKSLKQIAKESNLSPTSIARITDQLSYENSTLPPVISIDEFRGNAGGEKFQCILTNPKTHKVLDIIESRKGEALYRYFGKYTNRNDVKVVVMDMSGHFRTVMSNLFPNAEIVADKYHVVRQISWAFENVRKREQKRFAPTRRRYFKRSRRLLLKNVNKLTEDELEQVSLMLEISKPLAQAYYLKNEFNKVMKSENEYEAKRKLDNWLLKAYAANLPEFESAVRAMKNWRTEIINMFKYKYSNGFTEGCNNRIKVLKRVSYGVRNFERFRIRILHLFASNAA